MNHISSQLRPTSIGQQMVPDLVSACAEMLVKKTGYRFVNLKLLRIALTDPTYQYGQIEVLGQYQRYEFLGDTVLDICTTFPLFNGNPSANEEELTLMKHQMVSNLTYARLGKALGLDKFVITAVPGNYTDKSKNTADLVESLFGAIFLDSSLARCFDIFQRLVQSHSDIFYQSVAKFTHGRATIDFIKEMEPQSFGKIERWQCRPIRQHPLTCEAFRKLTGINLSKQDLPSVQMALTHQSAKAESSYERLEFIGGMVVKLEISIGLFFAFLGSSEAGLTI
jgi:dsRNA-specific ribonuclease